MPGGSKAIIGLGDGLSEWASGVPADASRHDGDNFRTNQVTLAQYDDRSTSNEAGALTISTAWACVNLLAGTQASLPRMVYRTAPDGQRTPAFDHPLWRILRDSPNADQTGMDFFEFVCACLEMRGNAYSEISRRGDGAIVALGVPIPPNLVTPRRLANGAIEYRVSRDGRTDIIPSNRMLHIRGFGGSPLGGLSTLQFAARTLGFQRTVEVAASSSLRRGVRPSIAIELERELNADQVREARDLIEANYEGAMNDGKAYLAHSGQKIKTLDFNPEDHLMLKGRGFGVEETCRFFGVPPFMVGHTEKSTSWGTGLEQQLRMFYVLALRRRLKRIEQALEKQLLSPTDRAAGVAIEFNVEGLLRGDSKSRAEFYASGLQNGWRTINEVRALENLPPVAGGDVPRMQMQVVPITDADGIDDPTAQSAPDEEEDQDDAA